MGKAAAHPFYQLAQAQPLVAYTLLTKVERRFIVVLVAFAGWFSTLSSFIYYPATPAIADSLHSSISSINLTVTSYLVVSAIAPAFVGDGANTFGRRPLYALTFTLYVAANVNIALQHSAVALLLLRMLQSIGISGAFSVAYSVIADISVPSERGSFVSALSFGITTVLSLGPVIGGLLASGPGWRWIFWFLTITAGTCLTFILLVLPETNRSGFMQPWARGNPHINPTLPRKGRNVPNPIQSFRILRRKDVAISIMPGSLLYTVYCCVHTSLASTFIPIYHLSELQAIVSTLISSKWIDHEYRLIAEAHGLPTTQASGDDLLQFPIEKARLRSALLPAAVAFASVLSYGWLHIAGPTVLLFVIGFSIQTCFNINNTLLVDINQDLPATAQASSNIVRCILFSILVAVLEKLINATGLGFTFTILSAFCLVAGGFYQIKKTNGMNWRLARSRAVE
ncbi:major facilitator superfamily transporter [Xylaria curta]|nr:major facilitator superfamily transporter [Xylaria curta]